MAQVAISARAATSRARLRWNSAWNEANFRPMVTGSAWMPWLRPMQARSLVSKARALQRRQQGVDVGQQQVGGLGQLHRQAGVQHVRRGHALMDEARLRPDLFGQFGQEGDDVVLGLGLDGIDPGDAFLGIRFVALFPQGASGLLRNNSQFCQGVAGMGFDLEPQAEPIGGIPDRGHLRAAVTGDHRGLTPGVDWKSKVCQPGKRAKLPRTSVMNEIGPRALQP